jgi:hypothetical protein
MIRTLERYGQTRAAAKGSLQAAPQWWIQGVEARRKAEGMAPLGFTGVADDDANQSIEQRIANGRHAARSAMEAAGYVRGKRPAIKTELGRWRKK